MSIEVRMAALKLEASGASKGIVISENVLARMGVKEGDSLFLVETADGYSLTPQICVRAGD